MGFSSYSNIGNSLDAGKYHYQYLTKNSLSAVGTAGYWLDLSPSSGQPKYNAYAGTQQAANQMFGSGNDGIFQGSVYSGSTKHLVRWNANTTAAVVPAYLQLCDYLMFYPLIDGDSLDQQDLDNFVSLPRYTDGRGVRAMLVAASPMVSTATLSISYTNQDGVSGRVVTFSVVAGSVIGNIVSCQGTSAGANSLTPFIPLASGDTGIRSVQSLTMLSGSGGFMNLVLVKPLAELSLLEASVDAEKHFGPEFLRMPEIKSGAYLNLIAMNGATAAWNLRCEFLFVSS